MKKPALVLISDIHFNLNNLVLASMSLKSSMQKAAELNVPLVIAGDLNDTKAIIRAEVANAVINILKDKTIPVYILEGNHDKINEKGIGHGLNYLAPYATIIDSVTQILPDTYLIPYHHDKNALQGILATIPPKSKLIMHQGFLGAMMGDYIQDKSSISTDLVKNHIVISGHYHRHQTLGTVTYIGSPYTITYGEANDGPKGFLVLNEDGTFDREILDLRKHVIIEAVALNNQLSYDTQTVASIRPQDLVWVKLSGQRSELIKYTKNVIKSTILPHIEFRLEYIPEELTNKIVSKANKPKTDIELLDNLIDNLNETMEQKTYLKGLYREILSSTN